MDLYLAGRRDEEVAREVGVSRQTVNGWRNRDRRLMDELRCRQNAMTRAMRGQQQALAWKVMQVVSHALDGGDARVALEIGKSLGLFAPVRLPEGPETTQELEEDRAVKRQVAREMAEEKKNREKLAHGQARREAE